MSEHLRSAEDVAWEALSSDDYVLTPHEVLSDLIRTYAAEVREAARAEVLGRNAVLRAWTNAGPRPDVHRRAKDVVRKTMPVLARALDEDERGLT